MQEIWKPFIENRYEASNLGRVRTIPHIVWRSTGASHTVRQTVLRPAKDKKGYLRVGLMINKKLTTFKVHRIIATLFKPNPENKRYVNHLDGNKANNAADNLEWATHEENVNHAIATGLIKMQYSPEERKRSVNKTIKRGSSVGTSLLTEKSVLAIRSKFIPHVYTRVKLAKEYNVTEAAIKDVLLRRTWKHI